MSARSRTAATAAVLATLAAGLTATATTAAPAQAVMAAHSALPSVVPAKNTPDVMNGEVDAIARVGTTTVLGGTFTSVAPSGGTAVARNKIVAFDSRTGALTNFNPTLTGNVAAIAAGPANTVYVAGISAVGGVAMKVARLDLATGAVVSGWKPPVLNAASTSLVATGGRLYVGGIFTTAAKKPHSGLIALDPATGALLPYLDITVSERHSTGPKVGAVGVKAFDVDPSGTHLVAVGNFTNASDASGTYVRHQIFRMNLGSTTATIDQGWNTLAFSSVCADFAFDSDPRDVQFDPTGAYFVIVATGGGGENLDHTRAVCDGAARFETGASGANVQPTWTAFNGHDSLWSVAVTGAAVFIGGHQRWMNNYFGDNNALAGAVPRPGLAALDPVNGLPLAWNPGRNPRGAGAWSLLATDDGLYVGSDTDWIGNRKYHHGKIAFFPLAGGAPAASTAIGSLPGTVYQTGQLAEPNGTPAAGPEADQLFAQHVDASGVIGARSLASSSVPWGSLRGAFLVGGTLFYGLPDGTFAKRSFTAGTVGPQVSIDPYNDPVWATVQTGSGQTYRGAVTNYYAQLPNVTSAFYTSGRLYYTVAGSSVMRYRGFTPDSGILGEEYPSADGLDWSNVAGAFLSGTRLYFATKGDGVLHSVGWADGRATGSVSTVDSSRNWATSAMVVSSD